MTFAFILESVGGTEWLVLLGVILIVVGPKNLPSAARKLGNIMSTLRRAADEFKRQLLSMDEEIRKAKGNPNKNVHAKKKNSNYGGTYYYVNKGVVDFKTETLVSFVTPVSIRKRMFDSLFLSWM